MSASVLLAKIMGPMLLVMGLFIVTHREHMREIGREFLDSKALIFLSGTITLPIGLAIVATHNIWAADWRVAITVFGWLAIAAGIARIMAPAAITNVGSVMLEKQSLFVVPALLMTLLGAYLSYYGYFA